MSKVPQEIFVVSQPRVEREYPISGNWNVYNEIEHNFGFLHAHEPRLAADSKRKKTQMDWAYRGQAYETSAGWYQKGVDYTYDYATHRQIAIPFDRPIAPEYSPRIWKNDPLTGFKIIDTVNRYRGNKLLKVMDPRGVEFEITVQSLYHIIQGGTVKNGEIMDACLWKSGKNLVLASTI